MKKQKSLRRNICPQQKWQKIFSITTKAGVEKYLTQRQKDADAGLIASGQHTTIKTHLQN
ncbi:hypothetical protein [Polynucleobacter sp.]|uniref:hypothetical protein n=1 Tax=Polynucleobacter sp. TaxID=2029855 RepID=UPI003F6974A3